MNEHKRWNVVYTRPRWEKKVAERLIAAKIETYCPSNNRKPWADRKKMIQEPLFPSYVFVHISDEEVSLVKRVSGVINLVHWMGKPALIRDEEIDVIKYFLKRCQNVRLEKGNVDVSVTGKVNILNGPFPKQGNVLEIQRKSVHVYLSSLGYQLIAEIEKTNVQIIKEFEIKYGLVS